MVPEATHPNWQKLLSGEIDAYSNNLSFNMLIFQVRLQCLQIAPDEGYGELIDKTREFFVKYESLLGAELEAVFPER